MSEEHFLYFLRGFYMFEFISALYHQPLPQGAIEWAFAMTIPLVFAFLSYKFAMATSLAPKPWRDNCNALVAERLARGEYKVANTNVFRKSEDRE